MEAQEIFDKVSDHLRSMTHRSINKEKSECMYRAPDGNKCAIGCLIPDDVYREEMEYRTAKGLVRNYSETFSYLKPHRDLLVQLQDIHDNGDWNDWGLDKNFLDGALKTIAQQYELKYSCTHEYDCKK